MSGDPLEQARQALGRAQWAEADAEAAVATAVAARDEAMRVGGAAEAVAAVALLADSETSRDKALTAVLAARVAVLQAEGDSLAEDVPGARDRLAAASKALTQAQAEATEAVAALSAASHGQQEARLAASAARRDLDRHREQAERAKRGRLARLTGVLPEPEAGPVADMTPGARVEPLAWR